MELLGFVFLQLSSNTDPNQIALNLGIGGKSTKQHGYLLPVVFFSNIFQINWLVLVWLEKLRFCGSWKKDIWWGNRSFAMRISSFLQFWRSFHELSHSIILQDASHTWRPSQPKSQQVLGVWMCWWNLPMTEVQHYFSMSVEKILGHVFFWIKCMNQVAKSSSIKLKQLSSIAPHPWVSANPEVPRGFILGWRLSVGKTYPIGETNPKRSRKNLRNLPFLLWFGLQGKWTKKKQRGVVPVRFRRDFPPNFPWFLS